MLDLGVNAGILASALTMVLAQRLLRLLCTKCAVRQSIGADDVKLFEALGAAAPADLAQAAGCGSCHAGYRGRTAVYEVIQVEFYCRFSQALDIGLPIISSLDEIGRSLPSPLLKNIANQMQLALKGAAVCTRQWAFTPRSSSRLIWPWWRWAKRRACFPNA